MMDELELFRRWCKQCGHYPTMELVDRWRNLPQSVRTEFLRQWALEDHENVVHIEFNTETV